MLSFAFGPQRFNYRVAGIFIVDNHVLICDEDDDGYCMLPGGRVELGEPSRLSLAREIVEEVGLEAEIGDLLITSESFYEREGQQFHELAFFYRARFVGSAGPDGNSPWRVTHEDGSELRFHWIDLASDGLERFNLKPDWVRDLLRNLPATLTHVAYDERERA